MDAYLCIMGGMSEKALKKAVKLAGSQAKLADLLGVRQPSVAGWFMRGYMPATRVLQCVAALGGRITKEELRPDLYR